MKIINVPIEPFEERYSKQWYKWTLEEFIKNNELKLNIIPEPLVDGIKNGSFLDVVGTNYYKASQLAEIYRLINEGRIKDDVFFLHDLWYPGLEGLAYVRDALNLKFKICGCLHAGTYDPWDFLAQKGMKRWGKHIEEGWLKIVDAVFVATKFHKDLICDSYLGFSNKIHVTGFPIYPYAYDDYIQKENIVVFPHRLDREKQPIIFDELAQDLKYTGWQFIKTKDFCKTKNEYYELLRRAKISVSCALQETWGIAMQESVFAGCIPAVPNRLSYKEMYDAEFRYLKYEDLKDLILRIIYDKENYFENIRKKVFVNLQKKGMYALPNMSEIMRSLC